MYCPGCGKPVETGVRFCSNCGTQVGSAGVVPPVGAFGLPVRGNLVRPRFPRMIAGVCSGFALHYGWDVSLVRVVTAVLAILTSGFGGLAYLAAWIIIPEAPYTLPSPVQPAANSPTGSPTV